MSLPVAFGRLHIAPLIRDFLVQYPEMQLYLTFSDVLSNPVEEELDLVIRIDKEVCEVKVNGSLVTNNSEIVRQVCLDGMGLILMPT